MAKTVRKSVTVTVTGDPKEVARVLSAMRIALGAGISIVDPVDASIFLQERDHRLTEKRKKG